MCSLLECTCYGHATSCTFNATVGYGVCDDCKDNTAGVFCHLCTEGFYPNMSVAIDDVDRCVGKYQSTKEQKIFFER